MATPLRFLALSSASRALIVELDVYRVPGTCKRHITLHVPLHNKQVCCRCVLDHPDKLVTLPVLALLGSPSDTLVTFRPTFCTAMEDTTALLRATRGSALQYPLAQELLLEACSDYVGSPHHLGPAEFFAAHRRLSASLASSRPVINEHRVVEDSLGRLTTAFRSVWPSHWDDSSVRGL